MGKVFKKIFGGSTSTPTIEQVTTDPSVTNVSTDDTSQDTATESRKKKRKGFASTGVASSILTGDNSSESKNILG